QFKRVPRHWVNIPLDTGDPEGMAQAFAQVAKTKALPVEQAIQLGFHPDALEAELDRLFHRQRLGLGDLGEGLG
ncbi:hypothetical protein, partial [Pseudomonas aeruginosa]|uniref:hypothetical protein n=1 Tax=Pseudomonas aeruginosa TaxID=287 RepID=UPI002551CB0C